MKSFKEILVETDLLSGELISLNEAKTWTSFAKDMQKIVKKYKKYETTPSSTPVASGYGNSTARAIIGGMIDYAEDFMSYGGTYGVNTYVYSAIKVGGGIDSKIKEKISSEVEKLVDKYKDALKVKNGDKLYGIRFFKKSGTNFHTYGVARGKKISDSVR